MTVAVYFELHAVDGRATLGRKTPFEAPAWISKATAHGRVSYWLCRRDDPAIEQLDEDADVQTLRARPSRMRDPVPVLWRVSA